MAKGSNMPKVSVPKSIGKSLTTKTVTTNQSKTPIARASAYQG